MNLQKETRGFRNNNPGNIRHGEEWVGLSKNQSDKKFCQFVSVEYGIRAIFKLLETYKHKYGLTTIEEIIGRWAPSIENETEDYIESVIDYMRIYGIHMNPNSELVTDLKICVFIAGIINQENKRYQPFTLNFIRKCRFIK